MKRTRPGMKQLNLWLPTPLVAAIKEYQHDQRLDALTQAADQLLRAALAQAGYAVPDA